MLDDLDNLFNRGKAKVAKRPDRKSRKRRAKDNGSTTLRKKKPKRRSQDFFGSSFQTPFGETTKGVFVPQWVIMITRTQVESLVLSQLVYWFGYSRQHARPRPRAKIHLDGFYWVAKTYSKLAREISPTLTKGQVRGALRRLKAIGVTITRENPDGVAVLYRLDPERIQARVEEAHAALANADEDDNDETDY